MDASKRRSRTRPDAQVGDEILTPISTEGLGRIAAQSAKQVIYQKVREAERENVYNEYIDRVGEVVNGRSSASSAAT